MPTLELQGLAFNYLDQGEGIPFFFQHGLGGDIGQPRSLFSPPRGIRFLSFDCRAHGKTHPLGDPARIGIPSFADDLLAILDRLGIPRAIVGGVSMGAAVALNFVLRRPERTLGLVLSRPAWLEGPMEQNAHIYGCIARAIREHGTVRGLELFMATSTYQSILDASPDAAASLVGQFEHPLAREAVVRLEQIPRDAPLKSLSELSAIRTPTLVLANQQDPIHPFAYAEETARRIAGAELVTITPKSVSRERHASDVARHLRVFLDRHYLSTPATPSGPAY
jgi:pimeloyl-ACP methyl ester carboxylesterase